MQNNNFSAQGFSLIELIGVVAIIAILGVLVAPKVLTSIEEAKIIALVQDVQRLHTVVTRYYKDTNQFPNHAPTSSDVRYHQLISNGAAVAGWNGPYIEKELQSPLPNVSSYYVWAGYGAYPFDVDGNGIIDFSTTSFLALEGVSQAQAITISDAIDGDANKTGTAAWYKGGKVRTRTWQATDASLFIMLTGK